MRIVNRREFLELPPGVIYSEYVPAVCTGLFVKGESYTNDYLESSLVPNCWNMQEPSFDEDQTRNGMFDDNQLYVVFEAADLELFRQRLTKAVPA